MILGIPSAVRELSEHSENGFIPGNPKDYAAIIVEPNEPDHLEKLRKFCTEHGIVLIFDEIITGFRYGLGGAQELYRVTLSLATFGKAMANGMPISALVASAS